MSYLCCLAVSLKFFLSHIIYSLQTWNTFGSVLQSQCRKYLARLHYMKIKKAAIATQCAWRVKVARKELRTLKMVTPSFFIVFSFDCIRSYIIKLHVVRDKINNEIYFFWSVSRNLIKLENTYLFFKRGLFFFFFFFFFKT